MSGDYDPVDAPLKSRSWLVGKPLLYFTSSFVSLGVLIFGYDQGVMSGLITGPYFKDYFDQPTSAELGTMVAVLEIGAFVSSLVVGKVGDTLGRRKTIFYGACIFVIGGLLQAFTNGYTMMLLGRIIAGLGVGMLSTIVPVYQSEISPAHSRGQLACIEFTGNIIGYASSIWIDYGCSYIQSDLSWRIPLVIQCVLGGILAIGSLAICESPRWLLDHHHNEEGLVVLANFYGNGDITHPRAHAEYTEIKQAVLAMHAEGERTYGEMFRRYKQRVLIAMSSQALAQLDGINVISYYAPLVFEEAGWYGRDAILMTGINGIIYVIASILPWFVIDRWGRRAILMSGAVFMCVALSAIAYYIKIDVPHTPRMVVILVIAYNFAFGYSWGPVPWLYPPEILPLSIRAKGASLSTACCWFFNFIVGETTPILQEAIGYKLYLMHAFWCAFSLLIVYFVYPETKGVGLEEMDVLFGDESVAPTPRSQSLADDEAASAPPDEAQVAEYLKQQGRMTDLSGLLDKLRGIPQAAESDVEDNASMTSSTRRGKHGEQQIPLLNNQE